MTGTEPCEPEHQPGNFPVSFKDAALASTIGLLLLPIGVEVGSSMPAFFDSVNERIQSTTGK